MQSRTDVVGSPGVTYLLRIDERHGSRADSKEGRQDVGLDTHQIRLRKAQTRRERPWLRFDRPRETTC